MILRLFDDILSLVLDESIKDEAIGDLWESDYRMRVNNTHALTRNAITLWRFSLLIKASIKMAIESAISRKNDNKLINYRLNELENFYIRNDLDKSTIRFIRHYCNNSYSDLSQCSVHQRKLYDSSLEPDDLRIRKIQFWTDQVDKLINVCESRTGYRGDCETVVNSLILTNLVRKLESHSPEPVNVETFRNLVENTEISNEFINRYVKFDDTYTRRCIIQTSSLCIYVISWKPGQETTLHHHGYALDAIKVIQGEMSHWITPPEKRILFEGYQSSEEEDLGPPSIYKEGDLEIIDRRYGHKIANLSPEPLVTLHIRCGHFPNDEHSQVTANALEFIWQQIRFFWNRVKTPIACGIDEN